MKSSASKSRYSAFLLAGVLVWTACGTRAPDDNESAASESSAESTPASQEASDDSSGATAAPAPEAPAAAPTDTGSAAPAPASPAPAASGGPVAGSAPAKTSGKAAAAQPAQSGARPSGQAAASAGQAGGQASSPSGQGGAAPAPAPGPAPAPAPGGSAAPAPGASAAAPCTGELSPLNIGSVSTMSGVLGEALAGGPKSVQAWAAGTNAAGGLRCHKIKYSIADDGGDPNRHAALVQEMVERQKVVAFVYQATPLAGFASLDYINAKGVPVIGNEGGSPWFYESKYFFPIGADGADGFSSFFATSALSPYRGNKNKYAVLSCVEAQACSGLDDKAEGLAKRFNVELVYKGKASLTQPDYTSHCLRAQQAGAEIIITALDGNSVFRLAKSCDSVGLRPIYTSIVSATREDFADDPLLDGFIGGYFELPWFRTDNPSVAQFHGVLKKFAPDLEPTPQTVAGWAVAKLFETAAQNISEPPTSASILQGLYSMKGDTIGGLLAPVTFTESIPTTPLRDCLWATQVRGGKWTGGEKMICPPKG